MEHSNQIADLVYKYIRNELTADELKRLQSWVHESETNSSFFEDATNVQQLLTDAQFKAASLENLDLNQVWQELKAMGWSSEQEKSKRQIIFIKWRWLSVAASILLMMTIGYLWLNKSKPVNNKKEAPVAVAQNDVAPGQTRAVLTLADGRKIVLDNVGNGKLADQGGITISNQNGQLVYKQNGTATSAMEYNTLATAKGETFVTQLADGTLAWLNAGSSIHYPVAFTGTERIVEITGEVDFEVKHDATKPFHVKVNGMDVQVLGTHFNVNAYGDEEAIKTTLIQGSVKISVGDKVKVLKPRQQAQISNSENKNETGIRVVSDVNTDEVIAWRNGLFNFNNEDIPTVLRQLARWYKIDIVYEGEIPKDKFVGEVERNLNLSQVLKVLERAGLQFTVQGRKLIVKQQ